MKREGKGGREEGVRKRTRADEPKATGAAKPDGKVVPRNAAKAKADAAGPTKRGVAKGAAAKGAAPKRAAAMRDAAKREAAKHKAVKAVADKLVGAAKSVARKASGKKRPVQAVDSPTPAVERPIVTQPNSTPATSPTLVGDESKARLREKVVAGPSLVKRSTVPGAADAVESESPKVETSYAGRLSGARRSIGQFPRVRNPGSRKKRERREELVFPAPQPVSLGAIGMESEFTVLLDGQPVKPEDVFKSPTNIVRAPMMHRMGRSYHLPSGGAVYFDTGVIEIATGRIEIEKGCAARAGRSLWENIRYLRDELDDWEKRHGHDVELQGFSTHYNVSFSPTAKDRRGEHRSVGKLALLLTYILPIPVMLLAANRRSTGVGVRPRGNRVEVTADFTPDAALMIATGTICVGIIKAVMAWPSYELGELDQHLRVLPMIQGVKPVPHSSRKGWSAKYTCYPENPFIQDIDEPMWATTGGERLSLRDIAGRITKFFWPSIQRFSDPFTLRLIGSVMRGRAPSLLELEERPAEYASVGRLCQWDDLFPERVLPRSRYERVLGHAISGERLKLDREVYTPVGMQGWAHVVFRKDSDKSRHVLSLDYLLDHLDEWDSNAR